MTITTLGVAARLGVLPLTRLHLVVLVISGFGLDRGVRGCQRQH
jgi:hypothetical protein